MKQLLKGLTIFLLAISIGSCKNNKSETSIKGSLKIAMDVPVWLGDLNVENVIPIDSTKTNESGEFSLTLDVAEPSLYILKVGPKSIYLVLKPKDDINIEIDNSIEESPYYVEGSTDSRLVQEIVTKQERVLDEITKISLDYEESKMDPENFLEKKAEIDLHYNNLLENHKSFTRNLIINNPQSLACIFALYQNFGKTNQPLFDKFDDFDVFNMVDSTLSAKYPNTPAVQALNRDVTDIKAQLKYKNYAEKLTEPGRMAPEFDITTIDNNQITLSEYTNHPVIYFFFATWNKPSAEEALLLNEIFKKYRYRGLRVVGISFDSSEEKLRDFIEENKILFPVACDYLYWDSDYVKQFGVRELPELILLTPDHIIERRKINTTELNHILTEWRKSNIL